MKHWLCLFCTLSIMITFTACQKSQQTSAPQTEVESSSSMVDQADPQKAMDLIYKSIDVMGLMSANDDFLKDKFMIDPDLLEEYYVTFSAGRFGVADLFILRPVEDSTAQVREMLEQIKLNRMKEFEHYDIHNSYQIAQDAQVFEQSGYLILAMLPDNESARTIIDQYIPKT